MTRHVSGILANFCLQIFFKYKIKFFYDVPIRKDRNFTKFKYYFLLPLATSFVDFEKFDHFACRYTLTNKSV